MKNELERVKVFPYVVVNERPLSELDQFADHKRLQTFYYKGCTCVTCGIVGTRFIQGRNVNDGSLHWDIYSDDLIPLTVDHIQPRSLGGPDTLENYQPMCSPCNSRKGNGLKIGEVSVTNYYRKKGLIKYQEGMDIVGMEIWRVFLKCHNRGAKPRLLGVVNSVGINPHSGKPAAIVVAKKVSYYELRRNIFVRRLPQGGGCQIPGEGATLMG